MWILKNKIKLMSILCNPT